MIARKNPGGLAVTKIQILKIDGEAGVEAHGNLPELGGHKSLRDDDGSKVELLLSVLRAANAIQEKAIQSVIAAPGMTPLNWQGRGSTLAAATEL